MGFPGWSNTDVGVERHQQRYRDPANFRTRVLACDINASSFDPIRTGISQNSVIELKLRGVLQRVQLSTRDVPPYGPTLKSLTTSFRRHASNRNVFLIEADHEGCDSHNNFDVIAVGIFDVHDEPLTSFWCTRLISKEGLLLRLDGNSSYRRIGIFYVEDEAWFDQGDQEDFVVI